MSVSSSTQEVVCSNPGSPSCMLKCPWARSNYRLSPDEQFSLCRSASVLSVWRVVKRFERSVNWRSTKEIREVYLPSSSKKNEKKVEEVFHEDFFFLCRVSNRKKKKRKSGIFSFKNSFHTWEKKSFHGTFFFFPQEKNSIIKTKKITRILFFLGDKKCSHGKTFFSTWFHMWNKNVLVGKKLWFF